MPFPIALVGFWANRTAREVSLAVLAIIVLGTGLKCYGDRREEAGERKARIAVADSVAAVVREEARIITDSAIAAMQRAELRADSAIQRARVAESSALAAQTAASFATARFSRLPPTVIAGLPPEVAAVLRDLEASNRVLLAANTALLESNRALSLTIDTLRAGAALARLALSAKDSALVAQDRLIIEMQGVQPKRQSKLRRWAGTALKVAIGAGVGYGVAVARK